MHDAQFKPMAYQVPDVFPAVPNTYFNHHGYDANEVQVNTFYITDEGEEGEMIYVVDIFYTEDGYGSVVLSVDAYGEFSFWSPYASFYGV